MPPSLSPVPTSTLYERSYQLVTQRFYNWSKTFCCSPLTFEPSKTASYSSSPLGTPAHTHCWCQSESQQQRCVYDRLYASYSLDERGPCRARVINAALLLLFFSLACPQVDVEKCYNFAEAGITLVDLQQQLAMYGLAMYNPGSIIFRRRHLAASSHRTGIKLKVLPGDTMALTLLLANGELVSCSHDEQIDCALLCHAHRAAAHRADRDSAAVARACVLAARGGPV